MKKLLAAISMLLVLSTMIVACDIIPNGDALSTGNESSDELNPDNNDTVDTSIKIEDDADREDKDNEFPFENIIVERNGYDIIAAGKYYGNDFDNVKYYGSYYRIIDNYTDFSELTQWGNQLEEVIFDENFVLVLYSHTRCCAYYSHPEFHKLNDKGQFSDFRFDVTHNKICISETHSVNDMNIDKDGYVPPKIEDYTVIYPIEKQEIIYLLISKDERPNDLPKSGEIDLYEEIIMAE